MPEQTLSADQPQDALRVLAGNLSLTTPDTEVAAMVMATAEMDALRARHPDWYAMYDQVLPDSAATRAELATLWSTAPTPFAVGLIYGKFSMRLEIAAYTGIAFI